MQFAWMDRKGFNYPHALVLHLPFALLPYPGAALACCLFTLGMTTLLAHLALRFGGAASGAAPTLALAAALLASRPGHMNLINGNVTAHVGVGACLALHEARRRPLLAALGLVLALVKRTVGLPLSVLLAAGRGDVRVPARLISGRRQPRAARAAVNATGRLHPAVGSPSR